ncbi:MAG: hypothetical protein ACJATT_001680 [Myxococcota bacterium]
MNFRTVSKSIGKAVFRWRTLGLLAVLYLSLGVVLFWVQTPLVFPATHMYDNRDAYSAPAGVDVIQLPSGTPLWLSGEHDRIVLMLHGNAEWVGSMHTGYAGPLHTLKFSFAAVEFRDVAGSPGPLTEEALREDVIAAIDTLADRGWPLDRIVLHGRSIGGGVMTLALEDRQPAGLVLESTFDSLSAVVNGVFPLMFYPNALLSTPLRTDNRLAGRDIPVFQVHDIYDGTVGIRRARALRKQLRDVTVEETAGYRHGTPIVLTDERAHRAWREWLNKTVPRGEE